MELHQSWPRLIVFFPREGNTCSRPSRVSCDFRLYPGRCDCYVVETRSVIANRFVSAGHELDLVSATNSVLPAVTGSSNLDSACSRIAPRQEPGKRLYIKFGTLSSLALSRIPTSLCGLLLVPLAGTMAGFLLGIQILAVLQTTCFC